MLIIPALDLAGGKCVRLIQGDFSRETVFGPDPEAMARRWINGGARYLHLVDLDGAREGIPRNREVIGAILEGSPIPVQVGGGIRDLKAAAHYLEAGARRVILGTAAFADPFFLTEACRRWPGQVAAGIDARAGRVALSGWTRQADISAVELARRCEEAGAAVIVYTDILRDGTGRGLNLSATGEMARLLTIPLIASGGISALQDIRDLLPLEKDGVCGVIVGRALYTGTLRLREALALAEGEGC
ncbi:MAG: 1-(5-phosphoribosyl)-5-[(5-phosphoribosylamino)methylideneamino]imidazole-4-carboxamide isomerase [Deltaproteobacteria bacterium]|nr:1-(5-phosphoribosyl)-5-[(5-phosphoribosylamino)methylideneamino]imidazole-4-carboxamide isomerase [Deltaproteobacteria bacterium]